jgi:hypothetical protein
MGCQQSQKYIFVSLWANSSEKESEKLDLMYRLFPLARCQFVSQLKAHVFECFKCYMSEENPLEGAPAWWGFAPEAQPYLNEPSIPRSSWLIQIWPYKWFYSNHLPS